MRRAASRILLLSLVWHLTAPLVLWAAPRDVHHGVEICAPHDPTFSSWVPRNGDARDLLKTQERPAAHLGPVGTLRTRQARPAGRAVTRRSRWHRPPYPARRLVHAATRARDTDPPA